jgi:hypothetical protein
MSQNPPQARCSPRATAELDIARVAAKSRHVRTISQLLVSCSHIYQFRPSCEISQITVVSRRLTGPRSGCLNCVNAACSSALNACNGFFYRREVKDVTTAHRIPSIGGRVQRDNQDDSACCLTKECSRADCSLPHANVPYAHAGARTVGGTGSGVGDPVQPNTSARAISLRQTFRRRWTVRSRWSG